MNSAETFTFENLLTYDTLKMGKVRDQTCGHIVVGNNKYSALIKRYLNLESLSYFEMNNFCLSYCFLNVSFFLPLCCVGIKGCPR